MDDKVHKCTEVSTQVYVQGGAMVAAIRAVAARHDEQTGGESQRRLAMLCREFDRPLKSFLLRRVRCPHVAEDLAQEVYLRIARLTDLDRVGCLQAFAYQTALNLVRDRSRRNQTRCQSKTVSIDTIELAGGCDPMDHAVHGERLTHLERALEKVSPTSRQALLMHRFDSVTYADIAHTLGVSVSMVEKHISAALVAARNADTPAAPRPRAKTVTKPFRSHTG